jgi:MFS family permease
MVGRPALGTALVFATSGAVQASWMSRLPAVRDRLHISLADLGFALLAMGAGTLVSMPVAGRLCRRFGSRPVTWVSTVLGGAALIALGSTGTRALGLVLFGFGLACGAWDTAMNVQGVAVETVTREHHMPRFHGWWSAGTLIGAGAGVLGARAHVPLSVHFVVAALVCVPLCALGAVAFVDERLLPPVPNGKAARKAVGRRLLMIAALTLCGATVEGAASDWLAIYLRDVRDVSHAHAAAGYTVFVLAMAVGRFAAASAHNRIGRAATVRLGALLAMAGIVRSVLAPLPLVPYVGAVCWGLGICVVFPAALSASGQASGSSDAVAAITTVGYSAGLVAPPLIGALAQGVGLGPALLGLPVLAAVVVVLAPAVGHGPATQPATATGSGP